MAQNTEIQDHIDAIEDEFNVEVVITGGGRGWTASVDGGAVAKATSKMAALTALYDMLEDMNGGDSTDQDEDPDGEFEGECSDECLSSQSAFCQCKCNGINHGMGAGRKSPAVMVGPKPCKCGCGETTKRTFVPGHDARYHGLVALTKWAKDNGITGSEEELRKAKASAVRKAARERRAAQRKAADARIAAVITTAQADGIVIE